MHPSISGYDVEQQIEQLYASSIFRARHMQTGQPALIKTLKAAYPEIRDIKRLEREYWVLREFEGVAGVVPVGELRFHGNGNPAIVSDIPGAPLSQFLRDGDDLAWSAERIVTLMIGLVEAVDAVHAHNTVHKNIAPHNILLDPETWTVRLMNFEIATVLSREHQDRSLSKRLEGSLPYISPEQTGRMSRDLDYRSDFYSLGVVFFRLLFGRLPFEATSRLEWVHAHIGKLPQIPEGLARAPTVLVEIALRLLAKAPEDRYQSCFGLLNDLRICQRQLVTSGTVRTLELAQKDVSEVFQVPQVLYGREAELDQLLRTFERAAAGGTEICMISGYSGVGKSALVKALNKPVTEARSYFLQGKFDQFERAKPYAGISAAFSGLIHEMLTEPTERLEFWREAITGALGSNGQALVDVIPELEQIIGPQTPVPALPPTEAQNRLQIVFQNFVRLLARPDRPLVLYLDDLQWSDAPTLNLLGRLAAARDIGNLMILGAYRSNEIDAGHLLSMTINDISKVRTVQTIGLMPLDELAVNQIVAAAVRGDPEHTKDLGGLLFRQTDGNPFFVGELLKSMVEEGLIRFDRKAGAWVWDIDAARRADVGESVVDFLIGNLSKLPGDTIDALRFAACIGHEFDLQMLSVVHEKPLAELGLAIMHALERNVILPLDEGYLDFDQAASNSATVLGRDVNPRFRFQHDRLHQAAYELTPDADKQAVHLSIGRLLQQDAGQPVDPEQAILIVRHLNEALTLISDPEERDALARLNLASAALAHDSSSYTAAMHYLRTARGLLREDAWTSQYDLARDLSALFAQTAYLTGQHETADAELSQALEHVRTPLEKAQILSMRTRHYSTLGKMTESIDAALQGLQLLGIDIERDASDDVVAQEVAAIDMHRAGRPIADLIDAPRMSDPAMSVAVGLLMEIFPAAFLSGAGNLFHLLVLKSVNLSLQYGNSTETAFAYAAYGMLLSGGMNDPAQGYEYGKLALAMNESYDDIGLKSRIIYVYGMFIHHWSNHWSSMTEWFTRGIEAGYQSGDLLYLAYNAQDCIIWDPALDVETGIKEQTRYLEIVRDCNYADSYDSGTLFKQMLQNFAGRTAGQYSLTDDSFDEQACLDGMLARKFMTGVANYNIYKAEIYGLYNNFTGALHYVRRQEKLIDSVMSLPQATRFRFVAFLTYASLPGTAEARYRRRMQEHHAQMNIWADHCPQNFRHLERCMAAEMSRLEGDDLTAFQHYEDAIECARAEGFQRDAAMIHERAASAFFDYGLDRPAQAHLAAARYLYYRWGAVRKVAQMDEEFPTLTSMQGGAEAPVTLLKAEDSDGITQDALDMASVMEAARVISGEIVLTRLLSRTMQILLESTGAQRGVFVSHTDDALRMEVECVVHDGEVRTFDDAQGVDVDETGLPLTVLNYALRTRAPLVLNDAAGASQFATDPYIAARQSKSVICVPITRTDQFEGLIYLENDLTTNAFPQRRADMVELLAAQASISIENARLYVGLEQKVQERTIELSHKTAALESVANQLSKYLSPQVYQSIFDQRREVKVSADRKPLTIFFSDLVGFTETADRMDSDGLTRLLNQYLSEMADIALDHGATVDKFVGDAIVIFFGDPESRGAQEDALACARMAVAMRERLVELRREWKAQGIERPFECRMGIHTGECTVGNFGSETRMDYTIIGGAVNLAARLESVADPGAILISDATHAQIKSEVTCTEHGEITVRGIAKPVKTYEIVELRDPSVGQEAAE